MGLMNIFDITGSAMSAQSVRLNTTASNMANADTAAGVADQVYRGRHPVFATVSASALRQVNNGFAQIDFSDNGAVGVRIAGIVEDDREVQARYEPQHPLADEEGFVYYPNVNVVEEMSDMISASRSFQANVEVMNAARSMMQRVLSMGR
ncbi:MAG: flagellar basal body rod protein FlgC [Pseudomonadales bacterium]|nr:flagellar basal body rod protein FlgC [Pseudomonadales bacterium]